MVYYGPGPAATFHSILFGDSGRQERIKTEINPVSGAATRVKSLPASK